MVWDQAKTLKLATAEVRHIRDEVFRQFAKILFLAEGMSELVFYTQRYLISNYATVNYQ